MFSDLIGACYERYGLLMFKGWCRIVQLTNGSTGQMFAVTFYAKKRIKAAIKNLLGEPGVIFKI